MTQVQGSQKHMQHSISSLETMDLSGKGDIFMRVSKKERKENAKRFYSMFMNSNCNKVAIVVQRTESRTNPNINRCQFLVVPSTLAFMEKPVIIVESNVLGIEGCFIELLDFIKPGQHFKLIK